jgi:CreA protein
MPPDRRSRIGISRVVSRSSSVGERKSLIFKNLAVRRIYDDENATLIYVVYSRQVVEGSAKMSLSSVALCGTEVT